MSNDFLNNKTRLIFQSVILLLILVLIIIGNVSNTYNPDFEAYCPFGGILSLGSKLWLGSMSCARKPIQEFGSTNKAVGGYSVVISTSLVKAFGWTMGT